MIYNDVPTSIGTISYNKRRIDATWPKTAENKYDAELFHSSMTSRPIVLFFTPQLTLHNVITVQLTLSASHSLSDYLKKLCSISKVFNRILDLTFC